MWALSFSFLSFQPLFSRGHEGAQKGRIREKEEEKKKKIKGEKTGEPPVSLIPNRFNITTSYSPRERGPQTAQTPPFWLDP